MKKNTLLLAIFILLTVNINAQKSINELIGQHEAYYDTENNIYYIVPVNIYDTIDVMLLCCDTTRPFFVNMVYDSTSVIDIQIDYYHEEKIYYEANRSVFWIYGKEVIVNGHKTIEKHICYLDEIGYKLPKEIIVWKSIKLKK